MKKILMGTIVLAIITSSYLFLNYSDRHPINQSTKTCLITGASSGIGYEISRKMIKRGWKVVGVARREEKLKDIAQELGADFIPFKCDVSVPAQIKQTSELIKKQGLQPTLFFLNAGTGAGDVKFEPILDKHKQTFDTNYFGVVAWIDEWVNDVKTFGGGTFVATSSIASIFGSAPGYCASKAALNSCFNALRLQYYHDGIDFVLVLPGPVATDMLKTPKPLPFTHQPADEAKYIVENVFKGKKQIEPAWFYSFFLRILSLLPDWVALKIA